MSVEYKLPIKLFLLLGVGIPTFLAIIGLGLILFAGQDTQLQCQRSPSQQITCKRSQRQGGLITTGQQTTIIENLQGATVGEQEYLNSEQSNQKQTLYNLLLTIDERQVPLDNATTSDYWQQQAKADQINQFIADPSQSSLLIRGDGQDIILVLGSGLIGVGTFVGMIFLIASSIVSRH